MSSYDIAVEEKGQKKMARCPFHGDGNERTPSMSINDETGYYKCFACHASGDAFSFVQEI